MDIKKQLRRIAGVLLIIAGIISFFLPVLQGWLFILLGLILLGNHRLIDFAKKLEKKAVNLWKNRKKGRI